MSRPSARPDGPSLVVLAAGQARRYGGIKPLAPVGLAGEAVIDVLVSDALGAGWGRIVLVVGPATGPAIRYHVERTWPAGADVHFALQETPRGTVDAVLSATGLLGDDEPFGVANADDLYGEEGLALLAEALRHGPEAHAIVCYRLRNTLIGDGPVTRGVCQVGGDGFLRSVEERRQVTPVGPHRIEARDGRNPAELDPDAWVSVNLWGFHPAMREVLHHAMAEAGGDDEVLLPELVGDLVAGRRPLPAGAPAQFRVLGAPGRCIGVTHATDLALVQTDLAGQVGRGERDATLWARRRVP